MSLLTTISGGQVQLTGNPVLIKLSGGTAPAGATQYQYMLRTISQDGKLYGAPFVDAITPDATGNATFDISGLVNQPVRPVFQYPPVGTYVAYPTQAFNVQVQQGERYIDSNGDLQKIWGTTSGIFQMLKGGLSPRQIAAMRDTGDTFYSFYIQAGRWLTARPWTDAIHPTQPVKMWFMTDADKTVDFKIQVTRKDGSKTTNTVAGINLQLDFLYEFNCNPAHYGIDLLTSGNEVVFYDVWLETDTVLQSSSHRFYIDLVYCQRPFFIMFENTFGGVDDVYFSGYGKDKFTTTGETVNRPALETDTIYEPTIESPDKMGQNKWTLNTGYKQLTTLQYYRDLFISKRAWYLQHGKPSCYWVARFIFLYYPIRCILRWWL